MFRKKEKEDPTELQLLKIRVQNLEKQIAEMKRAPQVQAEELLDDLEIGPILLSLANKNYSDEMKQLLAEWSSAALCAAKKLCRKPWLRN